MFWQPLDIHRTQGTEFDVTNFNSENKWHIINHPTQTSPQMLDKLRALSYHHFQEVSFCPSPSTWGNDSAFPLGSTLIVTVFWSTCSVSSITLHSVFSFASFCQTSCLSQFQSTLPITCTHKFLEQMYLLGKSSDLKALESLYGNI